MNFLERAELFLAGMFLSLGLVHFEVVNDLDQAAFWVTGTMISCWGIGALLKRREKTLGPSVNFDDAKGR